MSESLEVWLDVDFLPERIPVGTLAYDRDAVRFSYRQSPEPRDRHRDG